MSFGAVHALHAQTKAPAYVIVEIDVMNSAPHDREYLPPVLAARCQPVFAAAAPITSSIAMPSVATT
jgi:hypothetical protein